MAIYDKLLTAIKRPDHIFPYLRKTIKDRIYGPIRYSYIKRLKSKEGSYTAEVNGYKLELRIHKNGLDEELLTHGIREPVSTRCYMNKLKELSRRVDGDVRVLEVGANIGYYALMPATLLEGVKVFAAELDKENTDRLKRNIETNKVMDKFIIDNVALGDKNGETIAYMSNKSNLHSLKNSDYNRDKRKRVRIHKGKDWLEELGVRENEIHVLRMDIEGYESNALKGLPNILNNNPSLIHIEIHPPYLSNEEKNYICERLNKLNISTASINYYDYTNYIDNMKDVMSYNEMELVASSW